MSVAKWTQTVSSTSQTDGMYIWYGVTHVMLISCQPLHLFFFLQPSLSINVLENHHTKMKFTIWMANFPITNANMILLNVMKYL